MQVKFKKIDPEAIIPVYARLGDAGADLFSKEDIELQPGQRHLFMLGITSEFPAGYVALFWDKSGLASKQGLTVLGGVLDSGYRGEWGVTLYNTSEQVYKIVKGHKIAQVLFQKIESADFEEVAELSDSERGQGGFGSTGK